MAKKETREERNARLRENRAALIKAGFSRELADRYKAASRENVRLAIERGWIPEPKEQQRKAGIASGKVRRERSKAKPKRERRRSGGWRKLAPPNTWGSIKGRITYEIAGQEGNYLFLSPYTYIVTFVTKTKDKDGGIKYERKIVSINSEDKLTKKEIFDRVYDVIISDPVNEERYYPAQIIIGSFELVKAVANPKFGGVA